MSGSSLTYVPKPALVPRICIRMGLSDAYEPVPLSQQTIKSHLQHSLDLALDCFAGLDQRCATQDDGKCQVAAAVPQQHPALQQRLSGKAFQKHNCLQLGCICTTAEQRKTTAESTSSLTDCIF